MQKAIAYIRVSTPGQAVDGVSLDAQRSRIQAWCTLNEFELSDVFVDAGLSGSRADNRPELQAALAAVAACKGALVVYSLSRLARSTKDTIAISEAISKAGADLVSLTERIDTQAQPEKWCFRCWLFWRNLSEIKSANVQKLRWHICVSKADSWGRFLMVSTWRRTATRWLKMLKNRKRFVKCRPCEPKVRVLGRLPNGSIP